MTSFRQLQIQFEDHHHQNQNKWWYHPLGEDAFATFMGSHDRTAHEIFGEGSFFSPLLFGKFFDPSDAFPLWEFDAEALLPNLSRSIHNGVDWFKTDADYVVRAQLPPGE